MTPDEIRELMFIGAVGGLDDAEAAELQRVLASDADLAAEYASLQDAAAILAAATAEEPPVALRGSVLEAIASTEQLPPLEVSSTPTEQRPTMGNVEAIENVETMSYSTATPADTTVVPFVRRSRWMLPATIAAAAVLLLGGGLVANRIANAPSQDRVSAVLGYADSVTIPLDGSLTGLSVVTSQTHHEAAVVGDGVTELSDDLVYQLWGLLGEDLVGMITFVPDDSGTVSVIMDDLPDGVDGFAVTVEPSGGSDVPSSDPVAASEGF